MNLFAYSTHLWFWCDDEGNTKRKRSQSSWPQWKLSWIVWISSSALMCQSYETRLRQPAENITKHSEPLYLFNFLWIEILRHDLHNWICRRRLKWMTVVHCLLCFSETHTTLNPLFHLPSAINNHPPLCTQFTFTCKCLPLSLTNPSYYYTSCALTDYILHTQHWSSIHTLITSATWIYTNLYFFTVFTTLHRIYSMVSWKMKKRK